jgi:hypothetical protein
MSDMSDMCDLNEVGDPSAQKESGDLRGKVVYVAGPYRGDRHAVAQNISYARLAAVWLSRHHGAIPIVPHEIVFPHVGEDEILAMCVNVLLRCDAVVRLYGESAGADFEVAIAEENKIPVYRFAVAK